MLETLNRRLSGPSFVLSTVATHFPLSGGVWRFRVGLLGCWLVVLGGQAGVAFDDHVLIGWRADVAARPGCWLLEVSVMVVGSMLGGRRGWWVRGGWSLRASTFSWVGGGGKAFFLGQEFVCFCCRETVFALALPSLR